MRQRRPAAGWQIGQRGSCLLRVTRRLKDDLRRGPSKHDHRDFVVTMYRCVHESCNVALDEAHALLDALRSTGVDNEHESPAGDPSTELLVKILRARSRRARTRERVDERGPHISSPGWMAGRAPTTVSLGAPSTRHSRHQRRRPELAQRAVASQSGWSRTPCPAERHGRRHPRVPMSPQRSVQVEGAVANVVVIPGDPAPTAGPSRRARRSRQLRLRARPAPRSHARWRGRSQRPDASCAHLLADDTE